MTMKCPKCSGQASKAAHGQPYSCSCGWQSSEPKTSSPKTASRRDRVIATLDDLFAADPVAPENEDRPDSSLMEGLVSGPVSGGKHETNDTAGPANKVADFDTVGPTSDAEVATTAKSTPTLEDITLGGPQNSTERPNVDAVREQVATIQEMDKHETIEEREAEVKAQAAKEVEELAPETPEEGGTEVVNAPAGSGKIVININAAKWLKAHGLVPLPQDGVETCAECGRPMVIGLDSPGVSHHVTDDGDIDYDLDAHHVALAESGFEAEAGNDYQVEPITSGIGGGGQGSTAGPVGAEGMPSLASNDEIAVNAARDIPITAGPLADSQADFFSHAKEQLSPHLPDLPLGSAGAIEELAPLAVAATKTAVRALPRVTTPSKDYNGWHNWETWHVALLIDNEEPLYNTKRNLARHALKEAKGQVVNIDKLADQFSKMLAKAYKDTKAFYESNAREMPGSGWATEPFEEVNWHEIAENAVESERDEDAASAAPTASADKTSAEKCKKCGQPLQRDLEERLICPTHGGITAAEKAAAAKEAGFNFWFPGQVLREFYPEVQHEIVDYPNADNKPMIQDVDLAPGKMGSVQKEAVGISHGRSPVPPYQDVHKLEDIETEVPETPETARPIPLEDRLRMQQEREMEMAAGSVEKTSNAKEAEGAHFGQHENCWKCKSLSPAQKDAYNKAQLEKAKAEGDKTREKEAGSPNYVSTDPGAIGIGRDGKPQILDGAPLRKENDIRGPMFSDEFYANYPGVPGKYIVMASDFKKKAAASPEQKEMLADFLKKVMGEICVTFVAAFKTTSRPIDLDKIPGTGEVNLISVENSVNNWPSYAGEVGGRIKFLLEKMNDSDIADAINDSWAQCSVWHSGSGSGNFTYEVFCRAESIDTDNMTLKYRFVTGTKGD